MRDFAGLDPCTLLSSAEVERLIGVPDLVAARGSQDTADFMTCTWGADKPQVGVTFAFPQTGALEPESDRGKRLTEQIGHPADMTVSDEGKRCFVVASYDGGRAIYVSVDLDPASPRLPDGTDACDRSLPVVAEVLGARVPWN